MIVQPTKSINLTNINYPCFVQPKFKGLTVYVKDGIIYNRDNEQVFENEFNEIKHYKNFIIIGIIVNENKFILFDAVPVKNDNLQTKIRYENRIKYCHTISAELANYKKYNSIANTVCDNYGELMIAHNFNLKSGLGGSIIRNMDEYYYKKLSPKSDAIVALDKED